MSCHKVVPVNGKGLGVIATRPIKAGELILKERPFLSLPLDKDGDIQGKTDPDTGEFS